MGTAMDDGNAVLVFGGTGRLGASIVQLLVAADYPVTVFLRPTSDHACLSGFDVAYLIGDLTDADSVVAAVGNRPYRFVIDATARDFSGGLFYAAAMRYILDAVAGSRVRQFILHGSVGAGDNLQNFPDVGFERMRDVMREKGEAEALLKTSGIDYTIIRGGRVARHGTPATGTARLTEDDTVLAAVTRPDLAALTLQCLNNHDCMNKTFHAVDGD